MRFVLSSFIIRTSSRIAITLLLIRLFIISICDVIVCTLALYNPSIHIHELDLDLSIMKINNLQFTHQHFMCTIHDLQLQYSRQSRFSSIYNCIVHSINIIENEVTYNLNGFLQLLQISTFFKQIDACAPLFNYLGQIKCKELVYNGYKLYQCQCGRNTISITAAFLNNILLKHIIIDIKNRSIGVNVPNLFPLYRVYFATSLNHSLHLSLVRLKYPNKNIDIKIQQYNHYFVRFLEYFNKSQSKKYDIVIQITPLDNNTIEIKLPHNYSRVIVSLYNLNDNCLFNNAISVVINSNIFAARWILTPSATMDINQIINNATNILKCYLRVKTPIVINHCLLSNCDINCELKKCNITSVINTSLSYHKLLHGTVAARAQYYQNDCRINISTHLVTNNKKLQYWKVIYILGNIIRPYLKLNKTNRYYKYILKQQNLIKKHSIQCAIHFLGKQNILLGQIRYRNATMLYNIFCKYYAQHISITGHGTLLNKITLHTQLQLFSNLLETQIIRTQWERIIPELYNNITYKFTMRALCNDAPIIHCLAYGALNNIKMCNAAVVVHISFVPHHLQKLTAHLLKTTLTHKTMYTLPHETINTVFSCSYIKGQINSHCSIYFADSKLISGQMFTPDLHTLYGDLTITGSLFKLYEVVKPYVQYYVPNIPLVNVTGILQAHLKINGSFNAPRVYGNCMITKANAELVNHAPFIKHLSAILQFYNQDIKLRLLANCGNSEQNMGQISCTGVIQKMICNIRCVLKNVPIFDNPTLMFFVNGIAKIHGHITSPYLSGKVICTQAKYIQSVYDAIIIERNIKNGDILYNTKIDTAVSIIRKAVTKTDTNTTPTIPIATFIQCDIPMLTVKTKDLQGIFKGSLLLTSRKNAPLLFSGVLKMLNGHVKIGNNTIPLIKGNISYNKAQYDKLKCELYGKKIINAVTIFFFVNTNHTPAIQLKSIPDMNEKNILAYLLFGKPSKMLTAIELLQMVDVMSYIDGGKINLQNILNKIDFNLMVKKNTFNQNTISINRNFYQFFVALESPFTSFNVQMVMGYNISEQTMISIAQNQVLYFTWTII